MRDKHIFTHKPSKYIDKPACPNFVKMAYTDCPMIADEAYPRRFWPEGKQFGKKKGEKKESRGSGRTAGLESHWVKGSLNGDYAPAKPFICFVY